MLGFYPLSSESIAGMPIASVNNLLSQIEVQLTTQSTLLKQIFLQSDILLLETVTVNLDIFKLLQSDILLQLIAESSLQNIIVNRLESTALFELTAVANSVFYVDSVVDIKMRAYPNLNVNGNAMGSPGGVPVDGLYPPNNVIFILTNEDSSPVTKTVTSSIGDFTGYQIQNTDLISISLLDNIASVTVNTPYKLGSAQSQFISTKILTPQNVVYDYSLKFDQRVVQIKQQMFDLEGCQNAQLYLENNLLYARNEFYSILIGELKDEKELIFNQLRIISSSDILIEARCELQQVPTPSYYQNVLNTRVVDVIDQLSQIDLISSLRQAEPMEQYIELQVGQISAVYKILILPNFNMDRDSILETI